MFTVEMKKYCGANFRDCILEYRQNNNIWYLDAAEWSKLDKRLFDRILKDPKWGSQISKLPQKYCHSCIKFLDKLKNISVETLPDRNLYGLYEQFMKFYIPAHGSGHPANVLEMKNQRLSAYLKKYLKDRINESGNETKANEYFGVLATPTKDMSPQAESKEFYRLALQIQRRPLLAQYFQTKGISKIKMFTSENYSQIWRKIQRHYERWCWMPYNYEGPAYSVDYYIGNLAGMLRQRLNINAELKKLEAENSKIKKRQESIIKKYAINRKHRTLFKIASDIMFYKALRKDCIYKGAWASRDLYAEIAKRLDLTIHEARYIFYFEMRSALLDRKYDKQLIRSRTKEVVLHQRAGKKDIILGGRQASQFIKSLNIKKPDTEVTELQGQCAYPGKVRGRVVLVNTPEMMGKIHKGDILMAYATQPNLLPAMKKAAAFITDFGGITCHAAIVAREWKVPCVIGTGNATKILRDGEEVEVDATHGIIRRLG